MTDIEEERRLFYVAITRAEKRLRLSFAITRFQYGNLKNNDPSRFLDEVDPQYLKEVKKMGSDEPVGMRFMDNFRRNTNILPKKPLNAPQYTHVPSVNFVQTPSNKLQDGQRVEHQKFGFGVIKSIDHSTRDVRAIVQFEHFGERTLILTFAKLMAVKEG